MTIKFFKNKNNFKKHVTNLHYAVPYLKKKIENLNQKMTSLFTKPRNFATIVTKLRES